MNEDIKFLRRLWQEFGHLKAADVERIKRFVLEQIATAMLEKDATEAKQAKGGT